MCKCAKLQMNDCGDACLVVGGALPFYNKPNPSYWQQHWQTTRSTGDDTVPYSSTDVYQAYHKNYAQERHLAAADYEFSTSIEIKCGDYCAEVIAAVQNNKFEDKLTSKGVSAVVNKGNVKSFPTATSDSQTVTTNTHTTSTTLTTLEGDDYKNATIVLAVLCVLLLIAVIFLAATRGQSENGAGTKFEDTDAALAADSYEV
jgi:hypothetical protein